MKNPIMKRVLATFVALVLMITASATFMYTKAETYDVKAQINMTSSLSTQEIDIDIDDTDNNIVTMNYSMNFDPINKDDLPITVPPKEIVIVIDVSGSMKWGIAGNRVLEPNEDSRMEIVKEAAKSFLTNLNEEENIKVSLVKYNNKSNIYEEATPLLDLSDNYSDFITTIDNYKAGGQTNIGDAIRRANYVLQNGSEYAEKYMVLLTDGEPTMASLDSISGNTVDKADRLGTVYEDKKAKVFIADITDYTYLRTAGKATMTYLPRSVKNDPHKIPLNYAKEMSFKLLTDIQDINSYYIAFSSGSDKNKLNEISLESEGTYYTADSVDAINLVYEQIAEEIINEVSITDVVFQELLPNDVTAISGTEGIVIEGNNISKDFGSISFTLNEDETAYVADTYEFSVDVMPNTHGTYVFGANNTSSIHYMDIDGYTEHKYFNIRTLLVNEGSDPNLRPDNELDILEVQPGRVFELSKDALENKLDGMTVDLRQMSMNEFVGNIEELNGKYDVIYMGAIEDYEDYTITGAGTKSIVADIDITNRKASEVIEFAQTGQLLIVDNEIFNMNGTKLQTNMLTIENLSNVRSVPYFDESTINSLKNWYDNSEHRPRLTIISQPNAYDGTDESYASDHLMEYLYAAFNEQDNGMDTYLSIDLNGDGIFEAREQVLKNDVSVDTSGLSLIYSLDDTFNGLMPWKLELVDEVTNAKDYMIGFTAYKGDKTIVNVLQLSPGTNRMDINSNTFVKPLVTGDYEINVTYMQVDDFDIAYAAWENSEDEYPSSVDGNPTVLNGNYDMIIFGFGDSFGGSGGAIRNKDLRSQAAIDAIDEFINTGQGILFTHDTAGPQDYTNNFDMRTETQSYNDYVSYNDAPNITANFKDDMGFSNTRTYAGKRIWKAWGIKNAYKLNEGLITMYPYVLANNPSKNLAIAATHDQYWEIDLEAENVVPWFTLDAGNFKYYPAAYYYTFTNGNITYSGTGHSTPNGAEEQEFFVNTMLKASRGANHAPTMDVADIYDGMNIVPSVNEIDFELTIHDIDFLDEQFMTEVYTVFDDKEIRVKLMSNVGKEIPIDISFDKPIVLTDSVEEFIIKVVVTDEHGATGVELFNVTHKEMPTLIVSDNLEDGYLVGDTISLTYNVGTVRAGDKDLIEDIRLSSNINTNEIQVVNTDGWSVSGSTYGITPMFDDKNTDIDEANTMFNMTFVATKSTTLPLTGTYDVRFSEDGAVLANQSFEKSSAINVKSGLINVDVTDNLGRAIKEASITIKNSAGATVTSGLTGVTGIFKATGLITDTYTVEVTALPSGYIDLSIASKVVTVNYSNSSELVEFSAKDNAKPIIEANFDKTVVVTGDETIERPIHIKTDGDKSKVIATYMKKLEDGETTAEVNDFVGANAANNVLMLEYNINSSDEELRETPFVLDPEKLEGYEKAEYFIVSENGYYAIYAINESGNETVEIIFINSIIKELPDSI